MGINLSKGGTVNLTKHAADAGHGQLTKVRVGLGWKASDIPGVEFDLDASVFGLGANNLVPRTEWFVFFNNLSSPGSEIVHQGDQLTGGTGQSDDEQIVIDLAALPAEIEHLPIYVCIFEAAKRGGLNFSQVSDAYVRVSDETTGTELARFDLSHGSTAADANVLHFASFNREGADWVLKAVGEGTTGEVESIVAKYGV